MNNRSGADEQRAPTGFTRINRRIKAREKTGKEKIKGEKGIEGAASRAREKRHQGRGRLYPPGTHSLARENGARIGTRSNLSCFSFFTCRSLLCWPGFSF